MKMKRRDIIITIVFAILTIIFLLIAYTDRVSILQVLSTTDWSRLCLAFITAILAHISVSISLIYGNELFDLKIPKIYHFFVNFVTLAIGMLLDFGGVAGFSLRAGLLNKAGGKATNSIAASLFFTYFQFLTVLLSIPFGLISLYMGGYITDQNEKFLLSVTSITLFSSLAAAVVLFNSKFRRLLIEMLSKLLRKAFKKVDKTLQQFDLAVDEGIKSIKLRPWKFFWMLTFNLINWGFCLTSLWLCFYALNIDFHLGAMLIGFAVGITATNFAFVPGGIGVQEASMAGIYALMGLDFRTGVLISFMFRVVHYLTPTFLGLIIYWTYILRYGTQDKATS